MISLKYLRLVEIKTNIFLIVLILLKLNLNFNLNVKIIKKLYVNDIFKYLNYLKFNRN